MSHYIKGRTIYELDFGYLRQQDMQFFVALCGKSRQVNRQFPKILESVKPDFVINIGSAGSYPKFAKQFDVIVSANAIEVIDQSNKKNGESKRHTAPVYSLGGPSEYTLNDIAHYKAPDTEYITKITKHIFGEALNIDHTPKLISDEKYTVITDAVTHTPLEEHWAKEFKAKGFCCDQEAALIGSLCEEADKTPFLFLKGISDYCSDKHAADGDSKINQDYAVFFSSLIFCHAMLKRSKRGAFEISKLIESVYLAEGFKKDTLNDDGLSSYDQFLSQLITAIHIGNDNKSIGVELRMPVQSTVERILEHPAGETEAILVSGDYWSGRTLFCCLIYRFLLSKYPESKVFPIYINFAKHRDLAVPREQEIISTMLKNELEYLNDDDEIAIIMTRNSISMNMSIRDTIKSFIRTHRARIRVICLGLEDHEHETFYESELNLDTWDYKYRVNAIERDELLLDVNRMSWLKKELGDKYEMLMKLNPPIVYAETIYAVKRDIHIPDFKSCESWFSFIFGRVDKYCNSKLDKHPGKELYTKMGALAFTSLSNYMPRRVGAANEDLSEYRNALKENEITVYTGLGCFAKAYESLAVNYYCGAINEFDSNDPKSIKIIECIFGLASPYDHMANELFKGCINDRSYVAYPIDFVSKLAEIYSYLKDNVISRPDQSNHVRRLYYNGLAHCCYLIGRVDDDQAAKKGQNFLIEEQQSLDAVELEYERGESIGGWLENALGNGLNSREYRLFRRSMYISLMYLEQDTIITEYYDRYLDKLFEDSKEDELNRIFHIEYYAAKLNSPTPPKEIHIEKAIDKLWLQAKQKLELKKPRQLSINIFTVFSILIEITYSEEYEDRFKQKVKERALEYSEYLLRHKSGYTSTRVRSLARFVDFVYANDVNPQEYFFWLLGRFKHTPRTGWVNRDLTKFHEVQQVESVASHTYTAQFLARALLNEEHKKSGIDKNLVIKLLWAHDIPEAVVGDRVNTGDKERDQEIEVAYFISCFGLLPKISREITQIGRLVSEFEKGRSPSAFAARQLDKLENYLQLINYGRKFSLINNSFTYDQEFHDWYTNGKAATEKPGRVEESDKGTYEQYKTFQGDLRKFDDDPYLFNLFDELLGDIPQRFSMYKGSDLSKEFQFEELSRKIESACLD